MWLQIAIFVLTVLHMANSRWRFFRPKSKQEFNEQKKKQTLWSVTSKCLTELFPQNTYLLVRIIIEVCIHKTVEDWFFCINFTFSINLRCCIDIFNDCTFVLNVKTNCTHEHKREACERERKKAFKYRKSTKNGIAMIECARLFARYFS